MDPNQGNNPPWHGQGASPPPQRPPKSSDPEDQGGPSLSLQETLKRMEVDRQKRSAATDEFMNRFLSPSGRGNPAAPPLGPAPYAPQQPFGGEFTPRAPVYPGQLPMVRPYAGPPMGRDIRSAFGTDMSSPDTLPAERFASMNLRESSASSSSALRPPQMPEISTADLVASLTASTRNESFRFGGSGSGFSEADRSKFFTAGAFEPKQKLLAAPARGRGGRGRGGRPRRPVSVGAVEDIKSRLEGAASASPSEAPSEDDPASQREEIAADIAAEQPPTPVEHAKDLSVSEVTEDHSLVPDVDVTEAGSADVEVSNKGKGREIPAVTVSEAATTQAARDDEVVSEADTTSETVRTTVSKSKQKRVAKEKVKATGKGKGKSTKARAKSHSPMATRSKRSTADDDDDDESWFNPDNDRIRQELAAEKERREADAAAAAAESPAATAARTRSSPFTASQSRTPAGTSETRGSRSWWQLLQEDPQGTAKTTIAMTQLVQLCRPRQRGEGSTPRDVDVISRLNVDALTLLRWGEMVHTQSEVQALHASLSPAAKEETSMIECKKFIDCTEAFSEIDACENWARAILATTPAGVGEEVFSYLEDLQVNDSSLDERSVHEMAQSRRAVEHTRILLMLNRPGPQASDVTAADIDVMSRLLALESLRMIRGPDTVPINEFQTQFDKLSEAGKRSRDVIALRARLVHSGSRSSGSAEEEDE